MNDNAQNAAILGLETEIVNHEASAKRSETIARVAATDQERGDWNALAELELLQRRPCLRGSRDTWLIRSECKPSSADVRTLTTAVSATPG